jgi:hypothetical protein
MIGEPKFGEWKPTSSDEVQEEQPSSERLSEEEAFEQAERMQRKIAQHDNVSYDVAQQMVTSEKFNDERLHRTMEKIVAAFENFPPELAEEMRNVTPKFIAALARALRSESYITLFGGSVLGNDPSKIQMRLWSEQPYINSEGRADWGANIHIGIAESWTNSDEAIEVIKSLFAHEIETVETKRGANLGNQSRLFRVDTSRLPERTKPVQE